MNKFISMAVASVLLGGVGVAHSATLDTTSASTNDGVLANFSGIDWHANGGGWVQGFDLTGASAVGATDTFTFTYQAFAAAIGSTNTTSNLRVGSPGPAIGGYELTTYSVINETATCLSAGCSSIMITTNSGTWNVYFDTTPDANQATGTGFRDGVSILSGTWDAGLSTFIATGPVGPGTLGTGGGFLIGTVTSTNNAYINPNLLGTTLQASLQFPGQTPPTYTRPAAFDGVSTGTDGSTHFVIQTDTSQNFSVPEPATLALMGLGLVGMGYMGRRRQA